MEGFHCFRDELSTWVSILGSVVHSAKVADFRIVQANLHGGSRNTRDRLIPFCLFTDPEIGRVGLNEAEAVAAGRAYRVAKLPMQAVLRAWTLSEMRGFMKALVADETDEILGFMAVGPHAGEVLAVV